MAMFLGAESDDPHGQCAHEIHRLEARVAELEATIQEIQGVVGDPGTTAMAVAGYENTLPNRVRHYHMSMRRQQHEAEQRALRLEGQLDGFRQEIESQRARIAELTTQNKALHATAEPTGRLDNLKYEVRRQVKDKECALDREAAALERVVALEGAIRKHRDQRGDDRCWLDDRELYGTLPEGYTPPAEDTTVELAHCQRFIACRRDPATVYVSPERKIEELNAKLARLRELLAKTLREMVPEFWQARECLTLLGLEVTGPFGRE